MPEPMAGDPSSTPAMVSSSPAAPAIDGTLDDITVSTFKCCICLDLLYKPIVLACGHISCFWCVHKSMHSSRTSHCAMCRHPYNHFPSICQLLHHLLQRNAPATYKRREKEVLEEERNMETFSPQFLDGQISKRIHSDIEKSGENIKKKRNISSEEFSLIENGLDVGICKQVSANEVLCGLCKELLFKPAVLNCGHVYCRSCLPVLIDKPLKCQICRGVHPGDLPYVCLDLDHFLEEQFPREYTTRKQKELEKVNQQDNSSSTGFSQESSSQAKKSHVGLDVDPLITHYRVGCDSCGMYPIVGKRYRCKDCKELIGFDLCEACYNSSSKRPGRFNQQHTPDHEFELDNSMIYQKILRSKAVQRVLAYVNDNNLGRR